MDSEVEILLNLNVLFGNLTRGLSKKGEKKKDEAWSRWQMLWQRWRSNGLTWEKASAHKREIGTRGRGQTTTSVSSRHDEIAAISSETSVKDIIAGGD